jgi:hypothetical protein
MCRSPSLGVSKTIYVYSILIYSVSEVKLILLLFNKDWTFKTQSKTNIDTAALFVGLVAEIDTGIFFILLASNISIAPRNCLSMILYISVSGI